MPYKDPDPSDPNMLVGVLLPADADATRDMAYVFAEEFARMGHNKQQIIALFKNPYYGGAHGAYRALGEAKTLAIIDECLNAWGQAKFSILDFGLPIAGDDTFAEPEPKIENSCGESEQSKIENPKSKIGEGGGSNG